MDGFENGWELGRKWPVAGLLAQSKLSLCQKSPHVPHHSQSLLHHSKETMHHNCSLSSSRKNQILTCGWTGRLYCWSCRYHVRPTSLWVCVCVCALACNRACAPLSAIRWLHSRGGQSGQSQRREPPQSNRPTLIHIGHWLTTRIVSPSYRSKFRSLS